ncbi:hypothetical protein jhhlp_005719 [Lomentospora prolificans]|uniref:RNA polymerase II-associated protein RBA50 n=1 Tax=Lomentospora prolificans TaxID=41688 RepID=A0A2N3N3W6_9PEZI|nr:hypothetical protein jhhlp_005719 [Lomentospora prolificans]
MSSPLLVSDLVENEAAAPKPLEDSDFQSPASGFPAPKKRAKASAFKQRREAAAAKAKAGSPQPAAANNTPTSEKEFYVSEKRKIDQENKQRIADMSPAELEAARKELMEGLDPTLIERLFKRANLDEGSSSSAFDLNPGQPSDPPPEIKIEDTAKPTPEPVPMPSVKTEPVQSATKQPISKGPNTRPLDEDRPPSELPEDLRPITDFPKSTTHFPSQKDPDLDPSDPDFLESLHKKYFPNLPADPTKLAWMAPLPTENSVADRESPYHPDKESLSTSALRFDFKGRLIPPRLSRKIPVSKGLHHHGLAPEAAGYTIEELCILARSAVPAQRCIAFQVLGRILFRLGNGEWGDDENDPIAMGIWGNIKQGRALDSLSEEAAKEHGHRSSQAYAIEALWLFEKGGWKAKFSGR